MMKKENSGTKKTWKGDLLLFAGLLSAAGLLFLFSFIHRKAGGEVCVYIDGIKTASYPLSEDRTVDLFDETGNVINTFVICDGAVDMTDADCPDKTCVRMRKIRFRGETITCLPHKTVLQIEGGKEGQDVDIH